MATLVRWKRLGMAAGLAWAWGLAGAGCDTGATAGPGGPPASGGTGDVGGASGSGGGGGSAGGFGGGTGGGGTAGASGSGGGSGGGAGGGGGGNGGGGGSGGSAGAAGGGGQAGGAGGRDAAAGGGVGGRDAGGGGSGGSGGGAGGGAGQAGAGGRGGSGGAPPAAGATVCINADGPGGMETYALLDSILGDRCVEHPDADHNPPMKHIREETDAEVGNHFVFLAHRDIDTDRQVNFDRQRIEIKVHVGAADHLKGRNGQTFTYTWRFKIKQGMAFSSRFTHLFQFKSYEGDDGAPIVTITARSNSLEIIHTGSLARTTLDGLRGIWLEVTTTATFAQNGALAMTIKKPDGSTVLSVDRKGLDMWREGDYIRPKWGIYRSLAEKSALRAEEETVSFANFGITPGPTPTSDCRTRP